MVKNQILEIIKEREKTYVKLTEDAIKLFIDPLKDAMQEAFYDSRNVELYILDVGIVPQNFRFLRIEGKIITVNIGDVIEVEGESIEIDLENIWDFATPFSMIVPAALLDDADSSKLSEYLIKVKENNNKIPESLMKKHSPSSSNDTKRSKEFEKVDKDLDETQRMELKYLKNLSVH